MPETILPGLMDLDRDLVNGNAEFLDVRGIRGPKPRPQRIAIDVKSENFADLVAGVVAVIPDDRYPNAACFRESPIRNQSAERPWRYLPGLAANAPASDLQDVLIEYLPAR